MELINSINLPRLRNNEHFQFMTDLKNMIDATTPAVLSLETVYPRFTAAYDGLNAVILVDRGSVKTEQITALDQLRDRTWSALGARIRATLFSPVKDEVESAEVLQRVYDLYGNIRNMSYNEETAAISNLVEDFESPENVAHCNTVGFTSWVTALKQQNTDFQALLDARNIELANKESGDVKTERAVIDPIYTEIVNRLNAMVTLEMASAEVQSFIRELNQRIKYYKDALAVRTGRNEEG